MVLRKRLTILFGTTVLVLLLLFIGIRTFQYFHLQGLKDALATLVATGTGGNYILEIGETDIDYYNFAMALEDLVIRKSDPNDSSGILQVRVPGLLVDLGPVTTAFASAQFQIDRLTINEPVATIGLTSKFPEDSTAKVEPINIPHQIARFYPGIKAVLDHFDVKYFEINRAGLNLEKSSSSFQVRLLDLLVSDWDMRHLTERARIQLSLGNQSLRLQNSDFTFRSIVWNYYRRELEILDYSYIHRDSSQKETLLAEGTSIKIHNLDYERLISDEHYFFEELLIIEPRVTAYIHPHANKPEGNTHPLSDLLKDNFGTLGIRNGEIVNAQIGATIYREEDTIFIHLPEFNLYTTDFQVNEDSSTLMIDKLNLDIHETEFSINDELSLQFKNMIYDEDYNVKIDSLQVLNKNTSHRLLYSQEMDLYNFSVFHFIYENDLKVDSVFLRNAELNLGEDFIKRPRGGAGTGSGKKAPTLDLGRLHLEKIDVNIEKSDLQGTTKSLEAMIDDIKLDQQLSYTFRFLRTPEIHITGKKSELRIRDIQLEPASLKFNEIKGYHHDLEFSGSTFLVVPGNDFSQQMHIDSWQSVKIGKLDISGTLPAPDASGTNLSRDPDTQEVTVGQLRVGDLRTDLKLSDTSNLKAALSKLKITNATISGKDGAYENLEAEIASLAFQNGPVKYLLGESFIKSDSLSQFNDLEIGKLNDYHLAAAAINSGPFSRSSDTLDFNYLQLENIRYIDQSQEKHSTIDSVELRNVSVSGKKPYLEELTVYSPVLRLNSPGEKKSQKESKKDTVSIMDMLSKVTIYPGELSFGDQRLTFEKIELEANESQVDLDLDALVFRTPSSSVHVGQIWSNDTDLFIDSIYVVPITDYVQAIESETDVIATQVGRIQFYNVNWDTLEQYNVFASDSMLIDGFELSIKRDKRLPDSEHITKPYLLTELIPSPEQTFIPRINGRNGRVVYIEIGEKTGQEGLVAIDQINFTLNRYQPLHEPEHVSYGHALLYNQGPISYDYHRLDSGKFSLDVSLTNFPFELLNQMVDPLEAAKFRSGHLHEFKLSMIGDSVESRGQGTITYDDLHVEMFRKHQPDEKNFGSELLTLLVDKLILKHSKSQATAEFKQERISFKGPVNYWVKSGIHGASAAVMKGKSTKKRRKKQKDR